MGRLHTRYSPVRRSPPEVLPLDLHVLGLSLAFILSQDQTLRCTFLSLIPPRRAEPLTVLFEDSDAGCQSQLLTVKLCLALALP